MRILLANWSSRRVGGCETYVESVVAGLGRAGHEVGLLCEGDHGEQPLIERLPGQPVWTLAAESRELTLQQIRAWKPDVAYGQGFLDPQNELLLQALAPSIFFSHAYNGTCISGTRLWSRPVNRVCHRGFGWGCLLHYFPHGCGGRNPLRMWQLFQQARERLEALRGFRRVLVGSAAVRQALVQSGLPADRVTITRLPFRAPPTDPNRGPEIFHRRLAELVRGERPLRLLMVGRMELLKGFDLGIAAADRVARALSRAMELRVVGDGRLRDSLERAVDPGSPLRVHFTGWQNGARLMAEFAAADLLLVPSVWPEPFGLVGLEAAAWGVPAVGFPVGGITEWLQDGVNGAVAPGERPTIEGLEAAIQRCVESLETLTRMSQAAWSAAENWPGMERHVGQLTAIFQAALATPGP